MRAGIPLIEPEPDASQFVLEATGLGETMSDEELMSCSHDVGGEEGVEERRFFGRLLLCHLLRLVDGRKVIVK